MSEEQALKTVIEDVLSSETFKEQNPDWAKHWVPSELVSSSPFTAATITDEQLDTAIDNALESPEVAAALENVSKDAKELAVIDDELQATLDKFLETPEVTAMLENVAADAADDELNASVKLPSNLFLPAEKMATSSFDLQSLRNDFEQFKERVAKAFKHAGFKF